MSDVPEIPGLSTEPPPAPVDYVPAPEVYVPISGTETPTTPLHGDINPFYGDINPFHGDINPFYGDINPFWGDINPFYGDINPFHGDINPFHGDINPFWGDINPFWGDINPFYGDINPFHGDINPFNENAPGLTTIGNYWQGFGAAWAGTESLWTNPLLGATLVLKMNTVIAQAKLTWGASIQAQTGQSFEQAFLNPLLARYGINPNNATSMRTLTASQRSQFFMDWYDSLMGFAGMDRIDHWMRTVNWTPAITQQQGSGADSIIGLLDATPMNDPDIADNVAWAGGGGAAVNGHGVGVASLMVAAHDRVGVMGIAPNATVISYNPFDNSNTASWDAIRTGILSLASRNASVINMSLGVPGQMVHTQWRSIFFDPAVYNATWNRVFVMAAGNNGVVQSANVRWDFNHSPNLIIVGSTDVNGNISSFSNTPGTACFVDSGNVCREQMMNRFMVAPGELILLPDGNGGFVRRSGTSFSAPLVSGAITLLHDRWPWLAHYARETVDIMLLSARDLGAPGVDPVYGHGMLDVEASQAPLNFDNLYFFEMRNGVRTARSAGEMRARGVDTTWEAGNVYFHMYERVGRTFRDFTVPVSSRLVGTVRTLLGRDEQFQRFVEHRMTDWLQTGIGFSDTNTVQLTALPHLRVSVTGGDTMAYLTSRPGERPMTAFNVTETASGLGFTAGYGQGAMALNGQSGFGLTADHGRDGGINPLLALASGGEFASAQLPLGRDTSVSIGMTRNEVVDYDRLDWREEADRADYRGVDPLQADAMNLRITHRASSNLTLAGAYARIREHNALLGVQSAVSSDLGHGATSETATLSASLQITPRFSLAASGTLGRTRTGDAEQGFLTQGNGVMTTAFALSATRQGVLNRRDAMRLTLSQPLHIEQGRLAYRDVQVVDRASGELGLADQGFDLNGEPRAVAAELLYATPFMQGQGEIGLFGRMEVRPDSQLNLNQYAIGSRLSIRF